MTNKKELFEKEERDNGVIGVVDVLNEVSEDDVKKLNEEDLNKVVGGTNSKKTFKQIPALPKLGDKTYGCKEEGCKDAEGRPAVLEHESDNPVSEIPGNPFGRFYHCNKCGRQYVYTDFGNRWFEAINE